jgi:hypothetical protein
MPTPSEYTPRDAIPVSGIRPGKYIAELSDEELGHYCDYTVCMAGSGYEHEWVDGRFKRDRSVTVNPSDPIPLIDEYLDVWKPVSDYSVPNPPFLIGLHESRELCMRFERENNPGCTVGASEDCIRDIISLRDPSAASCRDELQNSCPPPPPDRVR